jgi:hypothetical protein
VNFVFWRKIAVFLKTEYSVTNSLFSRKQIRQKATKKTGFFLGDGVATFMPTGYNFQSFLKQIRQLSRNLPRDARHPGYIRKLKKNTLIFSAPTCRTTLITLEPFALNTEI